MWSMVVTESADADAAADTDAEADAEADTDVFDAAAADSRWRRPVSIAAAAALAIAIVALGLSAAAILRPVAASCQVAAWDAVVKASEIPPGWTIGATDIYPDNQTTTIAGPALGSGSAGSTIYASVTCFGDHAPDAITRSEQASRSAGRSVTPLDGIGEAGYAMAGDTARASALQFRRGPLVAYVASSGVVTDAELRQAGAAVDAALRRALGDVGATSVPVPSSAATPAGSLPASPAASAAASPEPSQGAASPVAPELEALMPRQVSGTTLVVQSATGDQVLGTDAASKALVSTLDSFGKKPADLQIAQAYDATGQLDVAALGFRVPGVSAAKLKPAVLQTWLFAGATGVTTKETTVSGVKVTEVSYGGSTSISYVAVRKDAVIVIQSGDATLAAAALAALP
jgi:hypothetical protein